jgi:hypothetical protein
MQPLGRSTGVRVVASEAETEAMPGGIAERAAESPLMTHPGGRPATLRDDLVAVLVAEIAAGANLKSAAAIAGVKERTLRSWRARAWSRSAADEPYVQLERRIQAALRRARYISRQPAAVPWQAIAAQLAANNPSEWGSPLDLIDLGVDVDIDKWFQ